MVLNAYEGERDVACFFACYPLDEGETLFCGEGLSGNWTLYIGSRGYMDELMKAYQQAGQMAEIEFGAETFTNMPEPVFQNN